MPEISRRLLSRIEADFPHHTDAVLERLHALGGLVAASRQDQERMHAAVLRYAGGRLDRLREAVALAYLDWRDLLVAADLGGGDWPAVLATWLAAPPAPPESPATRGELVETDGHRWRLRRRRLDLRLVKRLIHRPDVVVVAAGPGGAAPCRVPPAGRPDVWERVRRGYAGPGAAGHQAGGPGYLGYELTDEHGAVLLYLEQLG